MASSASWRTAPGADAAHHVGTTPRRHQHADPEGPGHRPVRAVSTFRGDLIATLDLLYGGQDDVAKGGPVLASTPSSQDTLARRLRALLASRRDVREVRMFGGLSFMVDERMAVAAGREGDLLVRTDPARHDELLRRGGEPAYMGKDRPMGPGWLTVPGEQVQDDQELAYWIEVGIDSRGAST